MEPFHAPDAADHRFLQLPRTTRPIYGKKFIRGISPGVLDGVYLHMLVYKRRMRWTVGARTARELTRRNSLTSRICGGSA